MNAGGRLAIYGAGLVVAFAGAFAAAGAIAPEGASAGPEGTDVTTHGNEHDEDDGEPQAAAQTPAGLSLSASGLVLSPVEAPTIAGTEGELSFQITTTAGEPVTMFETAHDKDLHLIVVRSDGAQYRHVHPELDPSTGTWSLPWSWDEGGSYRVYADFTPAGDAAEGVTLTRTIEVGGELAPIDPEPQRTDEVDDFTVTIHGDLRAGSASELTVSVERNGEPVTTLEPYLGAFGHLVALRQGDLAYLHVHAEGDEPSAGAVAGPDVGFVAETPTTGRYLLYFDFQVDGEVHTAQLVLDAGHAEDSEPDGDTHTDSH